VTTPAPPSGSSPSVPGNSPGGNGISVGALDAFTSDAAAWDNNAKTLDKARRGAAGLGLKASDFGPVGLIGPGVPSEYNKVQQKIEDRCREGSAVMHAIASNLIKTRDTYQNTENANVYAATNVNR